jgi:hypothetical protein
MGAFPDASAILNRFEYPSGFGLRRQAKRDTALDGGKSAGRNTPSKSAVAAARCRRSP